MFGMIKMLPLLLIVGGAGFGYHKIVINEKDNRINQQQTEIAAATQQNVALQTAAQTNEKTIRNLETQMKNCLLYTSPSPRDATLSRMPSSA